MPPNDRRWADRARMRRAASAHTSPTRAVLGNALGCGSETALPRQCPWVFQQWIADLDTGLPGCINRTEPKLIHTTTAPKHRVDLTWTTLSTSLALYPVQQFTMAASNSYFVPGYGISRAVIQNEIRYHCGPDAIVRPYTFQV